MSSNNQSRRDRDRDLGFEDLQSSFDDNRNKEQLWTRDDIYDDIFGSNSSDQKSKSKSKSTKPKHPKSSKTKSGNSPKANESEGAVCHVCGNVFSRRSNLYKHVRSVHSTTREYICKTCGFPFKRRDHLDKHVRTVHERIRSFRCDICGDLFSEKYNRDKHKKTIHETKRPYRCKCGAYFQGWDKMRNCLRCKRS